MKICFATHNQHKADEIGKIVPEGIQILTLDELGITEDIPETGSTLSENSLLKASYVFGKLGVSCFADDTGLETDALGGEPGVYSARYAGSQKSDEANMSLLLKNLESFENKSAAFKTVITFIDRAGQQIQFVGEAKGKIINEKRGEKGFGYDPIFVPEGESRTFAEMDAAEKNAISHRGKAVKKLIAYLNAHIQ